MTEPTFACEVEEELSRVRSRIEPGESDVAASWVFHIAERRIREVYRRPRDDARDPAREKELEYLLEASWSSPRLAGIRREEHELLLCALRQLAEDQREVIRLLAIEGRSYEEAGAVLGLSPADARGRLLRALCAWRRERDGLSAR